MGNAIAYLRKHRMWLSAVVIEDKYLKKERQQIEDAFNYALKMRFGSESQINSGKEYFEEKFKQ